MIDGRGHSVDNDQGLALLRGGLFLILSLGALMLVVLLVTAPVAAAAPAAQPPERAPHGDDLGPHGDFARGDEAGALGGTPLTAEQLAAAPRVRWTLGADGVWSDPAHWQGGEVPGEKDVVVLTADEGASYTVTVDQDAVVTAVVLEAGAGSRTLELPRASLKIHGTSRVAEGQTLRLAGGILTGPGDLEVAGTLSWTGGAMSGTGTTRILPRGVLHLEGAGRKVLSLRGLDSAGQMQWSGTGEWVLTFNAPVRNLEGGELVLAADALLDVYGPPGPTVTNLGTVRKEGSGTVTFEAPFTNAGELDLQSGTLHFLMGYRQIQGATRVASGAALRCERGYDIAGGEVGGDGSFPRKSDGVPPGSGP